MENVPTEKKTQNDLLSKNIFYNRKKKGRYKNRSCPDIHPESISWASIFLASIMQGLKRLLYSQSKVCYLDHDNSQYAVGAQLTCPLVSDEFALLLPLQEKGQRSVRDGASYLRASEVPPDTRQTSTVTPSRRRRGWVGFAGDTSKIFAIHPPAVSLHLPHVAKWLKIPRFRREYSTALYCRALNALTVVCLARPHRTVQCTTRVKLQH